MSMFMIIMAFIGGIVGAEVGTLQACMLAGFIGLCSVAMPENTLIAQLLSEGFIPYISFGGAVAATAFAGNIRKHDIHGAEIFKSLNFTGDVLVLLISGLFGVFGTAAAYLAGLAGIPGDVGCHSLIISAIFVRWMFGGGKFYNEDWKAIDEGKNRMHVWLYTVVLGAVVAFMASWLIEMTNQPFLPFYLSLATLLFMFIDHQFPPSHQITLTVAYAYMATGSIVWGTIFGMLGNVVNKIVADLINTDVKSHFDPPATSVGILSLIVGLIF